MASVNKFLSVLKAPTTSGNLVLHIYTPNDRSGSPVDQTLTLSMTGGYTEDQSGGELKANLDTALATAGIAYTGTPGFEASGIHYVPLYSTFVVDHVVNIWSQADYRIDIMSTPADAVVVENDIPVYATIKDFKRLAPILISDPAICQSSIANLTELLTAGSQECVNYMNGYVGIGAQYLCEIRGNYNNGFNLDEYPVLDWDEPVIFVVPYPGATSFTFFNTSGIYTVQQDTGVVTYNELAFGSSAPFYFHPLTKDTVLKMTYVAGLSNVHQILRTESIREIGYLNSVNDLYSEIHQGSGTVKFEDPQKRKDLVRVKLARILGR